MLGITSALYDACQYKHDIHRASGVQPSHWYKFDEVTASLGGPPTAGDTFPTGANVNVLLSAGTSSIPITAVSGTPQIDTTSMHRNCIAYDGTDDANLIAASPISTTSKAGAILVVFKKSDGNNDVLISETDTDANGSFGIKLTGANNANVSMRMGSSYGTAKTFGLTNNITPGQDAMLLIIRNSAGHTFIHTQNGLEVQNTANSDVLDMPKFGPIQRFGGAASADYTGMIGEFAMWNQHLDDAQAAAVIASIREKWNLSDL
tara:strand:- start:1749 stop:2534 length:786 start_codon:yes stop_codon:yes gene_type:complete